MSLRRKGGKRGGLESDLDRARSSRDWGSAINLAKKLSKSADTTLINPNILEALVFAENSIESKKDLNEAQNFLNKIFQIEPENEEAIILQVKLLLLQSSANNQASDVETILSLLNKVRGHKNTQNLPNLSQRQIQLLLEALLTKGMCLEERGKLQEALDSYKEASDFAQKLFDGLIPFDTNSDSKTYVEEAILRQAILHIQQEDVQTGIECLRKCFTGPFHVTGSSLQKVYSLLSQTLIRKTSNQSYIKIQESLGSMFVPQDEVEECILLLLLLIEEFQSHESDISHVFDDLCLAYPRKKGYAKLVYLFERLFSTRFESDHFWLEFGLSLIASGRNGHALSVINQLIQLQSKSKQKENPVYHLIAAKTCLNLSKIPEAIDHCKHGISRSSGTAIESQYFFILGVIYEIVATRALRGSIDHLVVKLTSDAPTHENNTPLSELISKSPLKFQASCFSNWNKLKKLSLNNLKKAYEMDRQNFKTSFMLAYHFATMRDVASAISYLQESLTLNNESADSWALLALLLSSQKRYNDALNICNTGLACDRNASLLLIKSKLESVLGKSSHGLTTLREAFEIFKAEQDVSTSQIAADEIEPSESDRRSMVSTNKDVHEVSGELSDHKSIISRFSIYSDTEKEATSLLASANTDDTITDIQNIDLWLFASDLFAELHQYRDSIQCIEYARSFDPASPNIIIQEGKIEELQNNVSAATLCYQRALSLNASHTEALIRLSALLCKTQLHENHVLAEQYLQKAIQLDAACPKAWENLGELFNIKGNFETASACFLTAVELEQTEPVLPFHIISINNLL